MFGHLWTIPVLFHCRLSKWLWSGTCPRTGSNTFLFSTGGKSQHQTDLFSPVLMHWALQSLGHPWICYPTLLQQDLLNYPACPWTGRAWREASHQLRALLAKSVKQIDFSPRPLGPSEQKETIFHLLFAQRAWSKNLQSGLEDAKCHPDHLQNFWMWPKTAMLYQWQLMKDQLWRVSLTSQI